MVKKKSWSEFHKTGLLLFINQILHVFGWAIVFEVENDEIKCVYPARTKFRGFETKLVSESYLKISKYMNKNSGELMKESRNE